MTPRTPRTDVFLCGDYDRKTEQITPLERFRELRRCQSCGKLDEEHLLQIGFDSDRVLSVSTDFWGMANDIPKMIVRQSVKDVFEQNGFEGVRYVPCGRNRKGEALYVLWKLHESPCLAPPSKWCYFRPEGEDLDEGCCTHCLRSTHTLGFPYHDQLEYPPSSIISVPNEPCETRRGVDFRFFCSQVVRDVIRGQKLTGISLPNVRFHEKFYPRSKT